MARKARKLYFDFSINAGSSSIIKLTEENATTPGDRWGCLLPSRPALNGFADAKVKAQHEITAIVSLIGGATRFPSAGDAGELVAVGFVNTTGTAATFFNSSNVAVAAQAGASSVFSASPRVKIKATSGSGNYQGTLYIQQQHSIEV